MAEEEKIIEINITIDKPYVIVFLLIVILFEAGYIGYLHFFQGSKANNTGPDLEPENNINTTIDVSFNFTEPETFDELKADLISVGVEKIIEIEVQDMRGRHLEANYTDALKMAREAAFVCVSENMVAFIMYYDGEVLIWIPS